MAHGKHEIPRSGEQVAAGDGPSVQQCREGAGPLGSGFPGAEQNLGDAAMSSAGPGLGLETPPPSLRSRTFRRKGAMAGGGCVPDRKSRWRGGSGSREARGVVSPAPEKTRPPCLPGRTDTQPTACTHKHTDTLAHSRWPQPAAHPPILPHLSGGSSGAGLHLPSLSGSSLGSGDPLSESRLHNLKRDQRPGWAPRRQLGTGQRGWGGTSPGLPRFRQREAGLRWGQGDRLHPAPGRGSNTTG